MTRREKADRILKMLEGYYPEPPVPLAHEDPFTLLVAVLLSAQTTDARVNLVTPSLFAEGPDPTRMAKLGSARILHHIRSCGLAPGKAKNIDRLAAILLDEHGGEVPADLAALETRAVRDGDQYVVNGTKVFTSGADSADFIWLACRTDPDAPKHSDPTTR